VVAAGCAGEADVMHRAAQRQAVLTHQPDPLAAGPGQLRGPGRLELAIQDFPEQPHRAVKVTDVMLDQVEAGRRARLGKLSRWRGRRRRTALSRPAGKRDWLGTSRAGSVSGRCGCSAAAAVLLSDGNGAGRGSYPVPARTPAGGRRP
jgi:hypothetical protein